MGSGSHRVLPVCLGLREALLMYREVRTADSSSQGGVQPSEQNSDSQLHSAETGSASNPSQPLLRKSRS